MGREVPFDVGSDRPGPAEDVGHGAGQGPARRRQEIPDPDPDRAFELAGQGRGPEVRAPTTTWSSPSTSKSCWPASMRCCAAPRAGASPRSNAARSRWTWRRRRSASTAANVDLTSYEYKVLEYLMMHAGELVSKADLTEHIYQQDFDRDSNVLEVFIGRLRKKLDPEGELKPIETVRGRGYRFAIPRRRMSRALRMAPRRAHLTAPAYCTPASCWRPAWAWSPSWRWPGTRWIAPSSDTAARGPARPPGELRHVLLPASMEFARDGSADSARAAAGPALRAPGQRPVRAGRCCRGLRWESDFVAGPRAAAAGAC